MTDHPNVRPIDPSDRRFVEGAVEFVPLHRAMPLRGRSAALRAEPLRVSGLRPAAAIAKPPFGERLVEFFRRWQFSIGMASLALATLVGCYFAFQMGRGQ